jgi:hypothetical protein
VVALTTKDLSKAGIIGMRTVHFLIIWYALMAHIPCCVLLHYNA